MTVFGMSRDVIIFSHHPGAEARALETQAGGESNAVVPTSSVLTVAEQCTPDFSNFASLSLHDAGTGILTLQGELAQKCLERLVFFAEEPSFNPNAVNSIGMPILHRLLSVQMSNTALDAVSMLLKKGAFHSLVNSAGLKPIEILLPHQATYTRWSSEAVKALGLLLEAGADPNELMPASGGLYETPLGRAVKQRATEAVRILLRFKADPNKFHLDSPPLLYAVKSGAQSTALTLLLMDYNADVRATKMSGPTRSSALEYAVRDRRTELVRILLGFGADPRRHVGKSRMTALHMAARRGELRSTQLLLASGASALSQDRFGRTPLHLCACGRFRGCVEVMRLLLQAGGLLGARDSTHCTPLLSLLSSPLITQWQVDLLYLLLASGDDPSAENQTGSCALAMLVSRPAQPFDSGMFLRAASALLAAHPNPTAVPVAVQTAVLERLPVGVERGLESLRQFRVHTCARLA